MELRKRYHRAIDAYIDEFIRRNSSATKERAFRALADEVGVSYRLILKWYYENSVPAPQYWRAFCSATGVGFGDLVADNERATPPAA